MPATNEPPYICRVENCSPHWSEGVNAEFKRNENIIEQQAARVSALEAENASLRAELGAALTKIAMLFGARHLLEKALLASFEEENEARFRAGHFDRDRGVWLTYGLSDTESLAVDCGFPVDVVLKGRIPVDELRARMKELPAKMLADVLAPLKEAKDDRL